MSVKKSERLQKLRDLNCSPATPTHPNLYSQRLRNSVKRNLNSSFGSPEDPSPTKVSKSDSTARKNVEKITLIINKKQGTCRPKYFYFESSDSEDEVETIVLGKRKGNTPVKDTVSPKKSIKGEELHYTPVKNKLLEKEVFIERSRTPRTPRTPQSGSKKGTPRSTIKLIRDGTITPKVQARSKAVELNNTPLKIARSQLHVSYIPLDLPCREKEHEDILNFLEGKLLDKCGGYTSFINSIRAVLQIYL